MEILMIVLIVLLILFAMWLYKKVLTKQTKMRLGITQILNDGSIVEAMDQEIMASSHLPFDGDLLASFFATYLTMRESKGAGNWVGLLSAYLFQWEVDGLIQTTIDEDNQLQFTFYEAELTSEIELELYDILKSNGGISFDDELLKNWSRKVLAFGEYILLESGNVAFDIKNRIRFTKEGYHKSLDHGRFAKYWMDVDWAAFSKLSDQRQKEELSFAMLYELTEEIEGFIEGGGASSEMLEIANRVWRF